jgi:hypothetical protein
MEWRSAAAISHRKISATDARSDLLIIAGVPGAPEGKPLKRDATNLDHTLAGIGILDVRPAEDGHIRVVVRATLTTSKYRDGP